MINPTLKKQLLRTFTQMVLDLKDQKEVEKFLTDFFDEAELEKNIKRLATIYWLKKGRDDENIKRNLGSSFEEISEAKKLLKKEGVKLALKKIEAEEWATVWAEKIKKLGVKK